MCRLKIKVRVIGKKNQEFIRFILVPKNVRQRGKYNASLGYWDIRQNKQMRYIVLDIYKIMVYYSKGATPNKTVLHQLYYYFVGVHNLNNWFYFKEDQLRLFLDDEIKKKYL
tara:strand:- start:207 stop:542 length:336 start_codon:yes stop_codon:yes gene_type:complete